MGSGGKEGPGEIGVEELAGLDWTGLDLTGGRYAVTQRDIFAVFARLDENETAKTRSNRKDGEVCVVVDDVKRWTKSIECWYRARRRWRDVQRYYPVLTWHGTAYVQEMRAKLLTPAAWGKSGGKVKGGEDTWCNVLSTLSGYVSGGRLALDARGAMTLSGAERRKDGQE